MKVRNLDKSGDWQFGQSQYNYTKRQSAIILDIKMRLREWYNDCFFALQSGIPWQIRLGYKNQKEMLDNDILTTVRETEGVLNVFNFSSSLNTVTRRYIASMSIYTEYGQREFEFEFS